MLLTLFIAFFSLILLMVIHEFGHFIIAKKFGIRVEEFGIGYPPRIFGKKFGETIYSSNLAIWKRILIVLGGVLAFWLAAIVIFSVVFSIGATVPVGDQDVVGITDT